MGQPVRLSDKLVLDARVTGRVAERSISGQIEYWAQLGRAIEPLLSGAQALALKRSGAVRPLSECVAEVGTAQGRARVTDYIDSLAFPHFQVAEGRPGWLVRIEEDGSRTTGRFVNRRFETDD